MRKIRCSLTVLAASAVLLSGGVAWVAGPPFDPHTAKGGLPQCKADLAACQAAAASAGVPQTGQTNCWDSAGQPIDCAGTGQDGEFQNGTAQSYTDNGDGTIKDNNTKLTWERKDDNDIGGIHDKDDKYTWDASFDFINTLNNTCKSDETVDCSVNGNADCEAVLGMGEVCGFAGHNDWRLPNVKELLSIVKQGAFNPVVSAAFNTTCVAGCMGNECSCTDATNHWSSTTFSSRIAAFRVDFLQGNSADQSKLADIRVRAVRGP